MPLAEQVFWASRDCSTLLHVQQVPFYVSPAKIALKTWIKVTPLTADRKFMLCHFSVLATFSGLYRQPEITRIIVQSSPQHGHWKPLNQGKALILFADWKQFSDLSEAAPLQLAVKWCQFTPSEALALTALCQPLHLSMSNLKSETAALGKHLCLYFFWQPDCAVSDATPVRSQLWKYFCSLSFWNTRFNHDLLLSLCAVVQIVILTQILWKEQDMAPIQVTIYIFQIFQCLHVRFLFTKIKNISLIKNKILLCCLFFTTWQVLVRCLFDLSTYCQNFYVKTFMLLLSRGS